MSSVQIRDMEDIDEYFVGTCSHVNESDEIDACAQRRITWLRDMHDKGLRVKVALVGGERVGFVYVMPIEICPWDFLGQELLAVPCIWVLKKAGGKGAGRALIGEVEKEAHRQHLKGIVTIGYEGDFWFMPASFFEKLGFGEVKREDNRVILWKVFDKSAEVPRFLKRNYHFKPIAGKVVVDLFWNTFCGTSDIEAQRIREVVKEFGDLVVLNEYCAENREILSHYQISRGIFVNGKEIGWGYPAPKEGIREAIEQTLKVID